MPLVEPHRALERNLAIGIHSVQRKYIRRLMPRKSLRRALHDLNARGRLALFMGAGVSMGCGLPSWEELIRRVLNEVWKHDPQLVDVLMAERNILAARHAKAKASTAFNRIVHKCLYENDISLSPCVEAIARSGIRHICNFNFDDLVEEALLANGIEPVVATPGENFESKHDRITVFHPSGMLPRFDRAAELDGARIVFSEDDYHNLYSDPYSWANVAQLALLTGFSVLFIGLSMQDPNLRRLIDVSRSRGFRNQHFAIFRDPTKGVDKSKRTQQTRLRKMIELDMKSLGVTAWFVDDHGKVAEIIRSISVPYDGEAESEG